MRNPAAAIAAAFLLSLAGCNAPYGSPKVAWAYYGGNYQYGHEGYDRPATPYGDAATNRPYGNLSNEPNDDAEATPDHADEPVRSARPRRMSQRKAPQAAAHDPSWYSTYYDVGP